MGLPSWRVVFLFNPLNPLFIEQPPQRPIERAGAQHNAPVAHSLDVLENGVPMPRLPRQTKQDKQDGFGEGQKLHLASDDMSYNAILPPGPPQVNNSIVKNSNVKNSVVASAQRSV